MQDGGTPQIYSRIWKTIFDFNGIAQLCGAHRGKLRLKASREKPATHSTTAKVRTMQADYQHLPDQKLSD